jgi:hypothetical protein
MSLRDPLLGQMMKGTIAAIRLDLTGSFRSGDKGMLLGREGNCPWLTNGNCNRDRL